MIPNAIHFIFGMKRNFGGRPFSLAHYIAVKSALVVNKPDKVYFYCAYEPRGKWWEKTKKYVEVIKLRPPRRIFGKRLKIYAHRADVLRLQILLEKGGIYLDMDTICVKSLGDLMENRVVLGIQGKPPQTEGLCNAVILSQKDTEFLRIWLSSFRSMRSQGHDKYWDEQSVKVPFRLWKEHPELLTVLDYDAFFHPLYDEEGLADLFLRTKHFPNAYVHHLWELLSWNYLEALSEEGIKTVDTTYNLLARPFLP
ncbi:MAG: hypothetical protein JXB23_10830 [Candidatus Aminicenantes bacterium]|nr:hypothetical protein [Candidatus Aminicenantes bacterium]